MAKDFKQIGDQLRQARLSLRLGLDDIADETKVSVKYLVAIEEGDISAFPSGVYYNLFVQSYAKELGVNPEELLEDLVTIGGEEADIPDIANAPTGERQEKEAPSGQGGISLWKVGLWLGGIVIAVFAVILILALRSGGDKAIERPSAADTTAAAMETIADHVSDNEPKEPATHVPQYRAGEPMRLSLLARQACWVMIMADGDTVLNRNLEPGQMRTLNANYRFAISAGNPSGLEVRLSGTLLRPLSPTGRPIKGLEINQLNKKEFYHVPEEMPVDTT